MKAVVDTNEAFLRLEADDAETDPARTRVWVPTALPEFDEATHVAEWTPEVSGTEVRQVWEVRKKTPDEKRYTIAPLVLLDRLSRPELKAVIATALAMQPQDVSDNQEAAWRLMLSLGAADSIISDGRASSILPLLFGTARAAQLLAPEAA